MVVESYLPNEKRLDDNLRLFIILFTLTTNMQVQAIP